LSRPQIARSARPKRRKILGISALFQAKTEIKPNQAGKIISTVDLGCLREGYNVSPLYFRHFVPHFKWMIRCSFFAALFAVALLCQSHPASGALARSMVLEDNVGYVRVTQTETNLADEIQSALNHLATTNQLAGIVLDLRSAGGTDASGLPAAEDILKAQKLPLAILVNAKTSGAAATLAYDLHNADTGLLFGSATSTLKPDITVDVSARDESRFLKNPYADLAATNSAPDTNLLNLVDIDHTSEADLVRQKAQDNGVDDSTAPAPATQPQNAAMSDPVLAHGVDFIKGLAALHFNKS
jgi:hypothetical protein